MAHGVAATGLQKVRRAFEVSAHIAHRRLKAGANAGQGREVAQPINATLEEPGHGFRITDVGLDHLEAIGIEIACEFFCVAALYPRRIEMVIKDVDTNDLMPLRNQPLTEMRADKACGTCDDDSHETGDGTTELPAHAWVACTRTPNCRRKPRADSSRRGPCR